MKIGNVCIIYFSKLNIAIKSLLGRIILNKTKIGYFILFSIFIQVIVCCQNSCPSDSVNFQLKMDNLIQEIKSKKRIKTDKEWDLIDKKFKRSLFECYPKIKNQLSDLEKVIFWENAMGYVYVRYGSNLLKKYREIDMTLTKIRDNIFENKISIKAAVKRLCKEWPVLYGTSEDEISDLFKDVFELKPKNKILPKGG